MKFGIRTPSLKKSISASTKGKITRATKRSINPIYGKKGTGLVSAPKKAVYNKVYSKITVSPYQPLSDADKAIKKAYSQPPKSTPSEAHKKSNIAGYVLICIGIVGLLLLLSGKFLLILLGCVLAFIGFACGAVIFLSKKG